MEKDPTFRNPENNDVNDVRMEYPSFEEHMAEMRGENNVEREKSPEQRQVEDLEVLFSFCDEKDVLKILKSDGYGVLLDNKVSLVDLFNADALFSEQYFADGYTREFGDRRYGNKLKNFARRHKFNVERDYDYIAYLNGKGEYDRAGKVRNNEEGYLVEDKIRAREAKQTIDYIAEFYLGDDLESEETAQFLGALKTRAEGEQLSDEQKWFLRGEQNAVADRLLYGGKVINMERASNILSTLNDCEKEYAENLSSKYESTRERADGTLVDRFVYAEAAINDYIEAERPELVSGATKKLRELVDKHFDKVAEFSIYERSDDYENRMQELILNYSDPFKLVERVKEYELAEPVGYDDDGEAVPGVIENPDLVVETVASAIESFGMDPTLHISNVAKDLKELGISDEAILRNCHNLRPVDFIDAKSYYDGSGSRLVNAGVDREKIIKEVFSSSGKGTGPFEKNGYPFKNESYVDTLEMNGFDITDIAKTFSPDVISKNINEFIERGADAKELVKHMINYREEFEKNIVRNTKGDISEFHRMWFSGMQEMVVWDEAHPDGRTIQKQGMYGSGVDYVALNLDAFASNGVTEEDIFDEIGGSKATPDGMFMSKMLECQKFDMKKVLNLGYAKYVDYLQHMERLGYFDKEYVNMASSPRDYYTKIVEQMNGPAKQNRDKFYRGLIEDN